MAGTLGLFPLVFSVIYTACAFLLSCLSARMQKPIRTRYSNKMTTTRTNANGDRFNLYNNNKMNKYIIIQRKEPMVGSLCQHINATSAVGNTHSSRFKLISNTVREEFILCALYFCALSLIQSPSPSQDYPKHPVRLSQHFAAICSTPITVGTERHCEREASFPRTQQNDPARS